MRRSRNQLGFTVIELVLMVAIVALIGGVGYKIYKTKKSVDRATNNTEAVLESPISTKAKEQSTIDNAKDLNEAGAYLDELGSTSEDDKDLSQLESELGAF